MDIRAYTSTNGLTLDQFIDNIKYQYYDLEYVQVFKYLLMIDTNSIECVLPIEMLINFARMPPIDHDRMDQKLEELGLTYPIDYIKTKNSDYFLSPNTFIKCLKQTEEGKCFLDDYYHFLETTIHKYLAYQTNIDTDDQWVCACDTTNINRDDYKQLEIRLSAIDELLTKSISILMRQMGEITTTISIYLGSSILTIVGIMSLAITYGLVKALYWIFGNLAL
jgi:hypothetical protein